MKDKPILSAFRTPSASGPADTRQLFDACHVGVVLRTVLLVELALAVVLMYSAADMTAWLANLAWLTGGALPATLAWLASNCFVQRQFMSVGRGWRWLLALLLGALAGLGGCGLLVIADLLPNPAWLSSAASGAMLAFALVALLSLRERGKTPAATTARLAELQSRIRPHFLFNTLNSAIALVRAEPARAEALLEDLSDLFRRALAEQGQTVYLAEEIELAQRYLAIEQVRFGGRMVVNWSLDPAASAALLPPLLLQPLVENAVLHGVEPSRVPISIEIHTKRLGSRVVIEVSNTLAPDSALRRQGVRHGQGVALENARSRLALLHDIEAEFQSVRQDGLYRVRIEIPA